MASGCGDVLSLQDLKTAKVHQIFEAEVITGKAGGMPSGADIDYATNPVTGQTQKTMPAILRDVGYKPASFDFTTGGTLGVTDRDTAVLWPLASGGDGVYYYWEGALPKVIPAASTPTSAGGVSDGAWRPVGDVGLRKDLRSEVSSEGDALITVKQPVSGAVARTQHSKNADVLSIKDFGAKGDGTSDDTAAIQAAVNSQNHLYVPPGVYRCTTTITVSAKICHIFGAGVGVSVLFFDTPTANGLVFDINYQQGGGVQNLTIASKSLNGDLQSVGSAGIGLYVKNANDNFFCDHFEVIRFGTGIKTRGCYQPRFTNFRVNWFSYAGVHLEPYDGTASSNGNGCLFSIGKISNLGYAAGVATATGIRIDFGSGEFFRDIDIQAVGTSVLIRPPTTSLVRYIWMDNILADSASGDGFVFDGGDAEVSNIFANGCWSSNNRNNGVTLLGNNLSGVQWRGGTIRGSQNNGINFQAGGFITFEGVMINNNSNGNQYVYPGVYIGASTSQFSLLNCIIGNLPDRVANLHQGSGVVIENGSSEAIRIIGNDLRAYGSGKKPVEIKGTLTGSVISSNLPLRTPDTNSNVFTSINLHSYNAIASGQNTYLTAGGVGSLSQSQQIAPDGIVQQVNISSSSTPGANQNYAYNLVIGGNTISLGTIEDGSFFLKANVKAVVSAGDNVALQVLTSAGAAAAVHKAIIIISQ